MPDGPSDLLIEALSHHQGGRLADAARLYQQELLADPDNADGLHLYGVLLYQTGDLVAAETNIRAAVQLMPQAASYWSNLGLVLGAQERATEAIAAYEHALELDSRHADAMNNLAKALIEQGAVDRAKKVLTDLIALAPNHYTAHNSLGLLAKRAGDLDAAEASLKQALRLNPDYFDGHFNLGNLQAEQRNHALAAESYGRAAELDETSAEAKRNLGLALLQLDRPEQATEQFVRAQALARDDPRTSLGLGTARLYCGQLVEAESEFRRVLELAPRDARAWGGLGTLHRVRREYDQALGSFDKALSFADDIAELYFNRGALLSELGRFADAERDLLRAIALDPLLSPARENLIGLYDAANLADRAKRALHDWLAVDPHNPIAKHRQAAGASDGDFPDRCAPEYIVAMFDAGARAYDDKLRSLDYRMPDYAGPVLHELLQDSDQGKLAVLDAGCGTGLCAGALRVWARQLDGVDLSGKMLQRARRLELYDNLVEADIESFLEQRAGRYDVIVSMDVLVYFGDLRAVLCKMSAAMRANGVLVVSAEQTRASEDFLLLKSGRYAHAREYVSSALESARLESVDIRSVILRMELGKPVWGHMVLARKST